MGQHGGDGTFNFPGLKFVGGDIAGVEGYCITNSQGRISEVVISQHGGAITNKAPSELVPPQVLMTGQDIGHSKWRGKLSHGEFAAKATVETDPTIIGNILGNVLH